MVHELKFKDWKLDILLILSLPVYPNVQHFIRLESYNNLLKDENVEYLGEAMDRFATWGHPIPALTDLVNHDETLPGLQNQILPFSVVSRRVNQERFSDSPIVLL